MTTLEALDDSIAHWKRLYTGTRRENEACFADNCALCAKFCKDEDSRCQGCPIAEAGFPHCDLSPWEKCYTAYIKEYRRLTSESVVRQGAIFSACDSDDFRFAAEDFHDWLVQLRAKYVDKQGEK